MIKINKGYNLKIISLIVFGMFLLNGIVYGIELSNKTCLRVPVDSPSTRNRMRIVEKNIKSETLAFNKLEEEWANIVSNFPSENEYVSSVFKRDRFFETIDKALKPIIKKDVLRAQKGSKELVYIISCGQKKDVSWLINALTELIPKNERVSWKISIVVTNIREESMAAAKKIISRSKLPIQAHYIKMNIKDDNQITALNELVSKHGLTNSVDGVMHNMGGALINNAKGYYKLLHNLAKKNSWFQVDRIDLLVLKVMGQSLYLPTLESHAVSDKTYMENISDSGFLKSGNTEEDFIAIFRAISFAEQAVQFSKDAVTSL